MTTDEPLLRSDGARPDLGEAALGDLAEEFQALKAAEGHAAAMRWYVVEALRSAPYFVGRAIRRSGWRLRAQLLATAIAVIGLMLVVPWRGAAGPPSQLIARPVVVNHLVPVRLRTSVLDSAGRALPDTAVRYSLAAGTFASLTPRGEVVCARTEDAVATVTLGPLVTELRVLCRPVSQVAMAPLLELVAGGPAVNVAFAALGPDGSVVAPVRPRMDVGDTTILRLEGRQIRPRAAGDTWARTRIGDRGGYSEVKVYQPAPSPEGIAPTQQLAVPVRLDAGQRVEWVLPAGRYVLRIHGELRSESAPTLELLDAKCAPAQDVHLQCHSKKDWRVRVANPSGGRRLAARRGTLLVWRQLDW